uniref:Uncharacterized protein n=1 Tax=Anguilla anguilla TaxID=7936 RepID=A0A0E9XBJ6_ANGAN
MNQIKMPFLLLKTLKSTEIVLEFVNESLIYNAGNIKIQRSLERFTDYRSYTHQQYAFYVPI